MRMLRVVGLLLLSLVALGCVRVIIADRSDTELVSTLQETTVALVAYVDDDGNRVEPGHGTLHAYCAGTWISKHEILTAAHCPKDEDHIYIVMRDDWKNDWITLREAHEVVSDEDHDMAALRVDSDIPDHPIAQVRNGHIAVGETVHVVGSSLGMVWSYSRGYVGQNRPAMLNAHDHPMMTLQVDAAVMPGNSGGGAFDADGKLIGVASFMVRGETHMGFFVHADEIRRFVGNLTLD
jgi:S1-C subfamily serine protease